MRRSRNQCGTAFLAGLAYTVLATAAVATPSRTVNEAGPLKVGKPCPSFGGYALHNDMLSLAKLLNPPKARQRPRWSSRSSPPGARPARSSFP
jgi:hypothetical protein